MPDIKPEPENRSAEPAAEIPESEEPEVVAHSYDDEELSPCCIVNNSAL
jgi:hypothetical protein